MVSLTIQLDDVLADPIRQLAAERNRAESEIVRDVLADYAQCKRPLPIGLGEFHRGQFDTSEKTTGIL